MATKVTINLGNMTKAIRDVRAAAVKGVEIVTEDFIRTSSEAAPKDKGVLEDSHSSSAAWMGSEYVATVDYSVTEENGQNGFNYAEWIHEDQDYNLGPNSLAKAGSGGATGMSGNTYEVDRKFMTRVIEGEAETYQRVIGELVGEACK